MQGTGRESESERETEKNKYMDKEKSGKLVIMFYITKKQNKGIKD